MLGLSIRQIEVFVAVATTGGVRQAADQLHLTQPAISMALGELERQLGAALFDRERGRLRLNAQGAEQLPLAREILERLGDMQRRHPDAGGALEGELRIGASNTVGNYLVGELLGPIAARHPMVALHLTVDNTRDITRMLLDHAVDIACVEGPVHHAQLDTLPWRNDALVVCAAPAHPLAQRARLQPRDFADARWILRERGSATRSLTEQAMTALPQGVSCWNWARSRPSSRPSSPAWASPACPTPPLWMPWRRVGCACCARRSCNWTGACPSCCTAAAIAAP